MAPKTRQSTINFRVKKNACAITKHGKRSEGSCESPPNYKGKLRNLEDNTKNSDINVETPVRTPRRNCVKNDSSLASLTPASALATLKIGSPAVDSSTSLCTTKSLNINTSELPCREMEIKEIEDFLLTSLFQQNPASLYISGLPGTGKTAALTKVIEDKKVCKKVPFLLDKKYNVHTVHKHRTFHYRI